MSDVIKAPVLSGILSHRKDKMEINGKGKQGNLPFKSVQPRKKQSDKRDPRLKC